MAILLRILIIIVSVLGFGAFGALIVYLTEEDKFHEEDRAKRDIHTKSGRDQSN